MDSSAKRLESTQRELDKFKQVAQKVTQDYDELYSKFTANEAKFLELRVRLQNTEEEYKKLQKLVEPAIGEYQELNSRYEIERGCRTVAQDYATKVVFENKKLKRQSQQLLDKVQTMDMSMEDIRKITEDTPEEANMKPEEENKYYNQIIQDLNDQIAHLTHHLVTTQEEYAAAKQREEKAHLQLLDERTLREKFQASLDEHQKSLQQYNRVSVRAMSEYQSLREKYETEVALKEEATVYAGKMLNEKKIAQRQSAMMMQQNPPSETLQNALLEIEDLEKQLHEEQTSSNKRNSELQELLQDSQDVARITELESKLEEATDQISQLQKQIAQAETDKMELAEKLQDAEKKLQGPPPPPPPPPPPLPSANFFKPANTLAKKKPAATRTAVQSGQGQENNTYGKALEEMMEKIKKGGNTLRPSKERRPSMPETAQPVMGHAIAELNSVIKRNRSASQGVLNFSEVNGVHFKSPSPTPMAASQLQTSPSIKEVKETDTDENKNLKPSQYLKKSQAAVTLKPAEVQSTSPPSPFKASTPPPAPSNISTSQPPASVTLRATPPPASVTLRASPPSASVNSSNTKAAAQSSVAQTLPAPKTQPPVNVLPATTKSDATKTFNRVAGKSPGILNRAKLFEGQR